MPRYLAVSRLVGSRAYARASTFGSLALCLSLLCATSVAAERAGRQPRRVAIHSLHDFESCQKQRPGESSELCLDALKAHLKRHPKDAFEAGKLVRLHYMYWVALEFFASALGDAPSKRQCADRDLRAAVLSGLALPTHYPAVALAQGLVNGPCHKQLEAPVVAQLKRAGRVFRGNACSLVSEKVQATRCRPEPEALAAASEPAPPQEPTKAELVAKAPALREAPPERPEAPPIPPPVQRLEDVFPSRPEARTRKPGQTAVAELHTAE